MSNFKEPAGFFQRIVAYPIKGLTEKATRLFFHMYPWPKDKNGLLKSLKFIIKRANAKDKEAIAHQLKYCAQLYKLPENQRQENPTFLRQRIANTIFSSSTGMIYTQPQYVCLTQPRDILNRRLMGVISGGIKSFLNSPETEQQKFLDGILPKQKQRIIPFIRGQQKD